MPDSQLHSQPKVSRRSSIITAGAAIAGAASLSVLPQPAIAATEADGQWWRWRGPQGNNHAAPSAKLPSTISPNGIAWAVKIPGRGHSSPIVTGDAVYLTTADKAAGTQSIVAVSRSGKPLWQNSIHSGGIPKQNHPNNTEASPTLGFDGDSLFASFYNSRAIWLTKIGLDGKILWQKNTGAYQPNRYKYGYAASPLIYRDWIILNADFDGAAFLTALDRRSGEVVWKTKRPGMISFSSPIIASVGGRDQLLLSGSEMVAGYNPSDGKLLWKTPGATTMATCGTMVWEGDYVLASGGYPKPETVCIKATGPNAGELVWSNRTKCYEQSMIVRDGYVYAVADNGVAYCWRVSDGKTMWRERIGGKYSSSPLLVRDTLCVFNESGDSFVFKAVPERFQLIEQSKLGDEAFASPVIVDDTLYARVAKREGGRQEYLLAIQ